MLGVVDDAALAREAERAAGLALSSLQPGVTRDLGSAHVSGFRVDRDGIEIGGDATVLFEAGRAALRTWGVHHGAGLRVAPPDAPLATGVSVVVAIKLPLVTAIAPCRIVRTVDEGDSFGFAYGTPRPNNWRKPQSTRPERWHLGRSRVGSTAPRAGGWSSQAVINGLRSGRSM